MATKTYSGVVLEDSPDVFLRLDEASGPTAADSSGNGNDFTHSGSPTLDQTGPVNKAVSYDGSDDSTTKTFGALNLTYPFTLETWIKTPSTTSISSNFTPWVLEGSSGDHFIVRLRTDGSNDLQADIQIRPAGASTNIRVSIPNTLKGEWVYIVAVFRSTTDREMWVNGVSLAQNTDSVSPTLSNIDRLTAGAVLWVPNHYVGEIAEPAFYSAELSEERIRIHHAVGRGFTDDLSFGYAAMSDGPSIYLTLGDASGDAADSSGWKRDATAAGSPTYGATGPLSDGSGDDAVTFDGTDDAFVLAGDDLDITDYPLTIEMFGKTPSSPANSTSFARLMLGDDGTEDNYFGLDLTTDGGGTLNARSLLETGGTADHITGSTGLTADTFYHIVQRLVSATERYLYVQGSQDGSDTDSRAFGSNINDLVIGRDLAGSPNFYAGTQGQILIYPRDIGATAVSDHFNAATVTPMGEESAIGRMDALVQMQALKELSFATLGFNSGGWGIRVELSGSVTKDFRNVQTFRGAIGIVADLDGVVSAQFTRERNGQIDIVAEFDSPVTFEKMKSGQIDAIVDLVAEKSEGETPVTDQDIGEAIVFRAPKIDYVFRARKHPTGRRL